MIRRLLKKDGDMTELFPRRAVLSATVAVLAASSASAAAPDHRWTTYGNARFEYTMCFPADLMTARPEAENGDGRAFAAKDGARMLVWGTYNTRDLTPRQVLNSEVKRVRGEGGQVGYTAAAGDWYVLSGTGRGDIFYQRGTSNDVRFASFRLTYPKTLAAKWKPIVAHLSKCLDGDPK